jgi:hypothetical protein
VRVYPSGRRAFVCSYRIHRRKRLDVLGCVERLTLDQARTLAFSARAKVTLGEDPKEPSRRRRTARTVATLCEAFIDQHAKQKRRAWKNDASCLRRRILPRLQHRLVSTISSADLEPIHAEIGVHHPYAANTVLELVRTMFNWGKIVGLVPKDYGDTHDEPTDAKLGYQINTSKLAGLVMQALGDFLTEMDAVKEGAGTLLDNMVVMAFSDTGYAKIHSVENIPMIIAGGAGGRHKGGHHIAGNGDPVTRVSLTAQQLVGAPVGEFGSGAMKTARPITEIMA